MSEALLAIEDLTNIERYISTETRLESTFDRFKGVVRQAVSPVNLRRINHGFDKAYGVYWGWGYLSQPYAPDDVHQWFLAWGFRFPGASSSSLANAGLPEWPHALAAFGCEGEEQANLETLVGVGMPPNWRISHDNSLPLVSGITLSSFPADSERMIDAMSDWIATSLKAILPVVRTLSGL